MDKNKFLNVEGCWISWLLATISERVARYLEREGWLARDEQRDHLTLPLEEGNEGTLQQLQGHSITYPIAMGPQVGRKVPTTCAARYSRYLPG